MLILDCQQQTTEWYAARCGVPSASQFDKIITTKREPSKQKKKYLYQLAGERITGAKEETFQSAAMQRGVELEDEARQFYQIVNDVIVDQVGFCVTEGENTCGCSPDGLVGEDGGIEIKCPTLPVHVEYLLSQKLPTTYFQQVQGSLMVTGRRWWDFISYYPGIKPLVVRVTPDEEFQAALRAEVSKFCEELDQITQKLREE